MKEESKVMIFLAAWVILGTSLFFWHIFNRNVSRKRRLHPWIVSAVCVLFTIFVIWISGFKTEVMVFFIPAVLLVCLLNIKLTKFCDSCGRTLFNNGLYWKMEFCPKCGTKLR